ncbi:hypothetical protein JOE64_001233 [Microbacterium dextranolyticum]|nr:hypothetical protein [Microbacterium dextranolyticum]
MMIIDSILAVGAFAPTRAYTGPISFATPVGR